MENDPLQWSQEREGGAEKEMHKFVIKANT
jgi:hypothetical protein